MRLDSPPLDLPVRFFGDLLELTKPRITLLVLVTTSVGLMLALPHPSAPIILATLAGVVFAVGGVNALNMYLEREADGRMKRTRSRPLPAGRLEPAVAFWFGLTLALMGVTLVGIAVNGLSAFLVLLAVATYVLVYTPLKQVSPWALPVGAVPGAMPPLIGWTAATGRIELEGLILFAIVFLWQIPHFHAIGLFRKDEYADAGFKILPVVRDERATKRQIVISLGLLLPVSLSLYFLGGVGMTYLIGAAALGLLFLGNGLVGCRQPELAGWARRLFFVSLIYLSGIYGLLLLSAI